MENSSIDSELQRIADQINKIRATQFACSVNDVATSMRLNKSTTYRRLGELRDLGIIEWTDNIAGSIRCVGSHAAQLPADGWQQKLRDWLEVELDDADSFADWLLEHLDMLMYPQPTESN
jgi:DNA-binding transcriptional regulator YhcF (GntR family)